MTQICSTFSNWRNLGTWLCRRDRWGIILNEAAGRDMMNNYYNFSFMKVSSLFSSIMNKEYCLKFGSFRETIRKISRIYGEKFIFTHCSVFVMFNWYQRCTHTSAPVFIELIGLASFFCAQKPMKGWNFAKNMEIKSASVEELNTIYKSHITTS